MPVHQKKATLSAGQPSGTLGSTHRGGSSRPWGLSGARDLSLARAVLRSCSMTAMAPTSRPGLLGSACTLVERLMNRVWGQ